MPTLLAVEVSPRGERSISRALGRRFVEDWQTRNPDGAVIYRDLNASRIPYMDNDWIAGVYAPPQGISRATFRTVPVVAVEPGITPGTSSNIEGGGEEPWRIRTYRDTLPHRSDGSSNHQADTAPSCDSTLNGSARYNERLIAQSPWRRFIVLQV
ncbi:MAG TPA: NAD(P)H-dependent oxidoreductase [Acidobacteriaceae bacterium]|nr:NAD(P)H-dependent oxidoreductase [Acidobacteriaceae bacterium]